MPKLLVIEPGGIFAGVLARLAATKGWDALIANSAAQARDLLSQHEFLACIAEPVLADSRGGEILDELIERGIPVVALSANTGDELKRSVLSKQVVEFIAKNGTQDATAALMELEKIQTNKQVKILIVDDSSLSRSAIKNVTSSHCFVSLEAANGKEALEILSANPDIKLIFTDYHMPVMDGFAFIKEARKIASKDATAIVVISAEQDLNTSAKFLKNGANDYLKKPFSKEELLARMYQNLEIIALMEEKNVLNKYNFTEQTKAYNKQKGIITNDLEHGCALLGSRVLYKSSDIMSGDLYSIHKAQDGSFFIYLLDGMGHGIGPSLTVFAAAAILKESVHSAQNLDELSRKLLGSIRLILEDEEQLSFSILHLSADLQTLDYTIGGMYPALIKTSGGLIRLRANCLPIMSFTQGLKISTQRIDGFEAMLLYSDGLVEERFNSFDKNAEEFLYQDDLIDKFQAELASKKTGDDLSLIKIFRR